MYKLNDQNEKTIQTFYEQKKHETEIKKYVIEELNNAKKKVSEYRGELKVFKGKDKEKRKNRWTIEEVEKHIANVGTDYLVFLKISWIYIYFLK